MITIEQSKKISEFDKRMIPVWVIIAIIAVILYFSTDGFYNPEGYIYTGIFVVIPAGIILFIRNWII